MEFGVTFTSRIGDYDLVALAESLGFDQAWFFDSQNDLFGRLRHHGCRCA